MSNLITDINNFFYNRFVNANSRTNQNAFQATYNYGVKEEQIDKRNYILSLFQRVILSPIKNYIFLNNASATTSFEKEYLLKTGGESVRMRTPDGDILDGMYIPSTVGAGSQVFIQDVLIQMYAADIDGEEQAIVERLLKDISRQDFENYLFAKRNITNESFQHSFIDNISISRMDIEEYLLSKSNISQKEIETYFDSEVVHSGQGILSERYTLRKEFYKRRVYITKKGQCAIDCVPSQVASHIVEKIKGTSLLWNNEENLGLVPCKSQNGSFMRLPSTGFSFTLSKTAKPFDFPTSFNRLNYDTYLQPNTKGITSCSNKRTVLISTPTNYPYYFTLADYYLKRGINVIMLDFRGRGESKGSPDSHKTKLDMETAYQYLREVHNLTNSELIIHGHCMGAGPALDLASRKKGTHVVIDRSFSTYQSVANSTTIQEEITDILQQYDFFTRLSQRAGELLPAKVFAIATSIGSGILFLVSRIASSIISTINYNNQENISKVEGNIAIIMSTRDSVTPEKETVQLINSLSDTKKNQVVKLLHTSKVGHTGAWWYRDKVTSLQLDQFLSQSHLL